MDQIYQNKFWKSETFFKLVETKNSLEIQMLVEVSH